MKKTAGGGGGYYWLLRLHLRLVILASGSATATSWRSANLKRPSALWTASRGWMDRSSDRSTIKVISSDGRGFGNPIGVLYFGRAAEGSSRASWPQTYGSQNVMHSGLHRPERLRADERMRKQLADFRRRRSCFLPLVLDARRAEAHLCEHQKAGSAQGRGTGRGTRG